MRSTSAVFLFAAVLATGSAASGAIRTQTVEYRSGEAVLEGYLAWDDAVSGKRPGVLVLHEWWGLNDYVKMRARELAELGYVAFAADVYGKGQRATTAAEAAGLAAPFRKDRALLRQRAAAALEALKENKLVDGNKIAAVGYCFGGMAALELARAGADLQAVVSFHGALDTPNPADARRIKAKVLVLTGGDDPGVPPEQVAAFQKEMREAGVDWQVVVYGGAVHAFTNPQAGNDPSRGAAYNERADRRSWQAMRAFFAETIGLPKGRPGILGRVGRFARDDVARPVVSAGKVTTRAVVRAATWTKEKITGE
jgi:dienelactone hydrolase